MADTGQAPIAADAAEWRVLWDTQVVLHYVRRDEIYRQILRARGQIGVPTITASCYAEVLAALARAHVVSELGTFRANRRRRSDSQEGLIDAHQEKHKRGAARLHDRIAERASIVS